jgi:hypothetical protein
VHLGQTIEEVVDLLGKPHEEKTDAGNQWLFYRCSSKTTCPVLERVGMPEYEGRYWFRHGVLFSFEYGYRYR